MIYLFIIKQTKNIKKLLFQQNDFDTYMVIDSDEDEVSLLK